MEKINSPQKKAVIDDRKTPHMNNLDSKVTNFGNYFWQACTVSMNNLMGGW